MLLGPGCVRHAGTGYITISSPSEVYELIWFNTIGGKQAVSWWVNQLQSISLSASLADDNVWFFIHFLNSSIKYYGRNS